MPKEQLLGKSYKRNQIYCICIEQNRKYSYSVPITKTGRQSHL